MFQKITNNGRPVIHRDTGLPIYNKSVDYRIKTIREIITISMNNSDARWHNIKNEVKTIV